MRCDACLLLAAGNHPDLRIVVPDALAHRRPVTSPEEDADGSEATAEARAPGEGKAKPSREIKIDAIRELSFLTELTAHRGGARLVVLGPAEALNLAAANALLKTLEEPPPETFFLLVCDSIDRCLPTIVSRCALVRVPLPANDAALAWLREQGEAGEAESRLKRCGGAPLSVIREPTEGPADEMAAGLLSLLRRGAGLGAADIAESIPRSVQLREAVALFQRWGWDYFSYRNGASLRYHPQDAGAFEALSGHWRLPAASGWMTRLDALAGVAEHPLNARSAVEGALLDYIDSIHAGH